MSETHNPAEDPNTRAADENVEPLDEETAVDPAAPETEPATQEDATAGEPATPKITASAVTVR